ncbi:MAG: hypothetical protein GTN80_06740 [Nitrososphaeria archaeon]|nr:hypothetical protein [Nitrososphaeria archaeon]NIN52770.1 hypothetical protein [Nitrososphaeria archaeon]NIQ33323.1 hypothetical protein [Nitrososphaeria archaeon]
MGVKVKILSFPGGYEELDLSPEEAEKLVYKKKEQYIVVDWATKEVLQDIKLKKGQVIALIPKIQGG